MRVKMIIRNSEYVAVNLENLNIFRVDETEANILSLHDKGLDVPAIASALDIPKEKCAQTIEIFGSLPKGANLVPEEVGKFNELLLMVALDCNMRCGYCYGNGGSFGMKRTLMSTETAFKAIDAALLLGDIRVITFFGGEPLLNFPLIKEVVERVEPDIVCGIITNGTIMNEEILDFIKEHRIPFTVSVDGPEAVNDAARFYADGRGTHKKIVETIEMLRAAEIPFTIEATFTKKALNLGYSSRDVLEYLYQFTSSINFASVGVVEDPEYRLSPQELRDFRIQCIDFAFDKIEKGEPVNIYDITALISRIASPERMIPKAFCPYHARRFAVFPNGDAYPCYLVINEKYRYGNIFDPDFVKNFPERSQEILPRLCREKLIRPPWFAPLLTNICVSILVPEGDNFSLHNDYLTAGPEVMEHLLYRMSHIRDWNRFFELL